MSDPDHALRVAVADINETEVELDYLVDKYFKGMVADPTDPYTLTFPDGSMMKSVEVEREGEVVICKSIAYIHGVTAHSDWPVYITDLTGNAFYDVSKVNTNRLLPFEGVALRFMAPGGACVRFTPVPEAVSR